MIDTYTETFNARGALYNEAALIAPTARETERRLLIDLLQVRPRHRICDAPAGGGYLAEGLRACVTNPGQIVCIEPAERFAKAIPHDMPVAVAPLERLPLRNDSLDRLASLAGLHHLADKPAFFREACRVLKPGGRLAVADVRADAANARFLNGPVDRFSTTGHKGEFLVTGEAAYLLHEAGFLDVEEHYVAFFWTFPDEATLVAYCRMLFGMVQATPEQVERELRSYLSVQYSDDGVMLAWSLVYAAGWKPCP